MKNVSTLTTSAYLDWKKKISDETTKQPTWVIYQPLEDIEECSKAFGLSSKLISAIIQTESGGRDQSARYEAKYPYYYKAKEFALAQGITLETEMALQRISWGVMQIMGAAAREQGFQGWLPSLCDADLGVRYGCLKLAQIRLKYPNLSDMISIYNYGHLAKNGAGKYQNQDYVDRVLGYLKELDPPK